MSQVLCCRLVHLRDGQFDKQNALANQKSMNWLGLIDFLSALSVPTRVPALSSALTPFKKVDKMLKAGVLRCSAEKLFHNALSLF